MFGRLNPPDLQGVPHSLAVNDGATVTFDVFEPELTKPDDQQVIGTLLFYCFSGC